MQDGVGEHLGFQQQLSGICNELDISLYSLKSMCPLADATRLPALYEGFVFDFEEKAQCWQTCP